VGVYGSFYVVEEMHRRNVCDRYWQCVGWSDGKVSEHLDVYQYDFNKKAAGITVDFNEAKTLGGMWNYEQEDGDMLTYEQFKEYMQRYETERAALEPGAWSQTERDWAEEQGIIRGDENGDKRWRAPMTREEYAVTAYRQAAGNEK
jgi:hypothetical protein